MAKIPMIGCRYIMKGAESLMQNEVNYRGKLFLSLIAILLAISIGFKAAFAVSVGFGGATTEEVLRSSMMAGSNCDVSNSSCVPIKNDWKSDDCTKADLDYLSCQTYNLYGKTFKMTKAGNPNTEGVFVKCDSGESDYECTKKGKFSITSDLSEATPNKSLIAMRGKNVISDDYGRPYYCPLTRCDVYTDDIRFQIEGSSPFASVLNKGEFVDHNNVRYEARKVGDNLCVTMSSMLGPIYLGCKLHEPFLKATDIPQSACTDGGAHHSRVFFSVSSRVIECVRSTLDLLFFTDGRQQSKNIFQALQDNLRKAVMVAILLYVILFGIRIATGGEQLPGKGELFMFILKIGLVVYFSIGVKDDNGNYKSGLVEIVYTGGMAAMTSLSEYVMSASSTGGLCRYVASDYPAGYSYMALWDALDCRISYYLGLGISSEVLGILQFFVPLILAAELIFAIFILIYLILIFSIVVYFVHFYIIAMISIAIMVYLGVIVVPLALFTYTKKFYDKWLSALISFVLQPVIITAFLAFMMMVFDSVIFGNCKFNLVSVNVLGSDFDYWTFDGHSCSDANDPRCADKPSNFACTSYNSCVSSSKSAVVDCKDSIGWRLLYNGNFLTTTSSAFFDFKVVNPAVDIYNLVPIMLKVLLFAYLVFLFSDNLSSFAAELTSGPNIGKFATAPGKVFKDAMEALTPKGGKGGGKDKGDKGDKTARGGVNVSGKGSGGGGKGVSVVGKGGGK